MSPTCSDTSWCLQYDVLKRVSAEGAMRHTYFDALGPAAKLLPDSKQAADYYLLRYQMNLFGVILIGFQSFLPCLYTCNSMEESIGAAV